MTHLAVVLGVRPTIVWVTSISKSGYCHWKCQNVAHTIVGLTPTTIAGCDRSLDTSLKRSFERSYERSFERSLERSFEMSVERSFDKPLLDPLRDSSRDPVLEMPEHCSHYCWPHSYYNSWMCHVEALTLVVHTLHGLGRMQLVLRSVLCSSSGLYGARIRCLRVWCLISNVKWSLTAVRIHVTFDYINHNIVFFH